MRTIEEMKQRNVVQDVKNKRGESTRSRKMMHVQNIDKNNNPYTT